MKIFVKKDIQKWVEITYGTDAAFIMGFSKYWNKYYMDLFETQTKGFYEYMFYKEKENFIKNGFTNSEWIEKRKYDIGLTSNCKLIFFKKGK